MTFSFCLNKTDVLVLCGIALLYQSLGLNHDSKLVKDIQRLFNDVVEILDRNKGPGTYDLKRVASILISMDQRSRASPAQGSPEMSMGAPRSKTSPSANAPKKKLFYNLGQKTAATMSRSDLLSQQEKLRRMTIAGSSCPRPELHRSQSRTSLDRTPTEQSARRRDHRFSISQIQQSMMRRVKTNLDYLSFNTTPAETQASSPMQSRRTPSQQPATQSNQAYPATAPQLPSKGLGDGGGSGGGVSIAEWEALLGAMDNGQMYDAIYGGPSFPSTAETRTDAAINFNADWPPPDVWDLSATGFSLGDLAADPTTTQSVPSISDDSLSSGEDLASSGDLYLNMGGSDLLPPQAPAGRSSQDGVNHLGLDGLDLNLGL